MPASKKARLLVYRTEAYLVEQTSVLYTRSLALYLLGKPLIINDSDLDLLSSHHRLLASQRRAKDIEKLV
jgi:hypothetical protein